MRFGHGAVAYYFLDVATENTEARQVLDASHGDVQFQSKL
jgi:hypothetical protein